MSSGTGRQAASGTQRSFFEFALAGGNGHRLVGLAQLRTRRSLSPSPPAAWAWRRVGGVVHLFLPTHVAQATQLVRHGNVPAILVTLASVGSSIEDLAESSAFANRSVGRLDKRPLERAAADEAYVPAERRFVVSSSPLSLARGASRLYEARCLALPKRSIRPISARIVYDRIQSMPGRVRRRIALGSARTCLRNSRVAAAICRRT